MRRLTPLVALVLAACSQGADQRAADPAAKAGAIDPQPIGYFDIKDAKLIAAGCNFVADGGGMGATALAQGERAAIKLDGKMVLFAPDKASAQLPQEAWSHYSGKEYALALSRIAGGKHVVNGAVEMFDAHLVITDPRDKVVYASNGSAQCKPM